jgi:flagellar basal body P-ring formation protein FlgA
MMRALALIALFAAGAAQADVVAAARTLRAGTAIGPGDIVVLADPARPGIASDPEAVMGLEARVTLYAGRPIPESSLGPPALVERNALVTLVFERGGLAIRVEGRALGRGSEGEAVRVMNLASRSTVSGTIAGPALVRVP